MQPANAGEAWNVVRLAMNNAERLFAENRTDEVKEPIVLLGPSLKVLGREGAIPEKQEEAGKLAAEAFGKVNLLVRESMSGNLEGARAVFSQLQPLIATLAGAFEPSLTEMEIHSCVDHPEVAEREPGKTCPECGKPLRPRRFPYSVIYAENPDPQMRIEVRDPGSVEAGKAVELAFRLSLRSDEPAGEADLVLTHGRRMHLLLLGGADDFQQLAPEPGNEPGTFVDSFLPSNSGAYRGWVMVVPAATRLPEFLPFAIGGTPAAVPPVPAVGEMDEVLSAEKDGVVVRLLSVAPKPLQFRSGETQAVRLHFSKNDGTPVVHLEPLWNAFSHLTLVSWDSETVAQVHPIGGEILRETLRGGPDLTFKLHPPRAGWWRLFVQFRVDGRTSTVPLRFLASEGGRTTRRETGR